MESIKSKVDDYVKRYPQHKAMLESTFKYEEDKIVKLDDEKREMLEKAKQLFEYDIDNYKKFVTTGNKYKLELLNNDDFDYKVLESSLRLNDILLSFYRFKGAKFTDANLDGRLKPKVLKIYRIISTDNNSTQSSTSNSSGILLLHGTKAPNVEGILKSGFKPSKSGAFGPGVYLTDCVNYASSYGKCFARKNGMVKSMTTLFVNQIKQTDIRGPSEAKCSFQTYLKEDPGIQVFTDLSGLSEESDNLDTLELDSPQIKFDSSNNKILKGTFNFQKIFGAKEKIILAHHDLVVPAYLIEIEERTSVQEFVETILYKCLTMKKRVNEYEPFTVYQEKWKNEKVSEKFTEFSEELIMKEIEKEINANQQSLRESIETNLPKQIDALMEIYKKF